MHHQERTAVLSGDLFQDPTQQNKTRSFDNKYAPVELRYHLCIFDSNLE